MGNTSSKDFTKENPVGSYQIKEIECKFLCLNRAITLKLQDLLNYLLSVSNPTYSNAQQKTPGEQLSIVLQLCADEKKGKQYYIDNLKCFFWNENQKKFFINQDPKLLFKPEIDITQLDISITVPILQKIPFFPTCLKDLSVDLNSIKHSNSTGSCNGDQVCCGICLECFKCIGRCKLSRLSKLKLDRIRKIRNKVHLTPQQFKEINEVVKNDPLHKKSLEWDTNIRELADCIKTICTTISPQDTCYKDCSNCKSIDKVVNEDMHDYMKLFFDNEIKLQNYREKLLTEQLLNVSEKVENVSEQVENVSEQVENVSEQVDNMDVKIDAINTKLTTGDERKTKKYTFEGTFKIESSRIEIMKKKFETDFLKVIRQFSKNIKQSKYLIKGPGNPIEIKLWCFKLSSSTSLMEAAAITESPELLRIKFIVDSLHFPEALLEIGSLEMESFCNELQEFIENAFKTELDHDDVKVTIDGPVEIGCIIITFVIQQCIKNWKNILEFHIKTPTFNEIIQKYGLDNFTVTLKEDKVSTKIEAPDDNQSSFTLQLRFDCFSMHVLNGDDTIEAVKESLRTAFHEAISSSASYLHMYNAQSENTGKCLSDDGLKDQVKNLTISSITKEYKEEDRNLQKHINSFYWVTPKMLKANFKIEDEQTMSNISKAVHNLALMTVEEEPMKKLACILDCCNNAIDAVGKSDADELFLMLLYITLKSNPPKLYSNLTYLSYYLAMNRRAFTLTDDLTDDAHYLFGFAQIKGVVTAIKGMEYQEEQNVLKYENVDCEYIQAKYTDEMSKQFHNKLEEEFGELSLALKQLIKVRISIRDNHREDMEKIADALDEHKRNVLISKAVGLSCAVAGGVISIVGFGLMFTTFGVSAILIPVGASIGGAGGITAGISGLVEYGIKKSNANDIKVMREEYEKIVIEVFKSLQKIEKTVNNILNLSYQIGANVGKIVLNVVDVIMKLVRIGVVFQDVADVGVNAFRAASAAGRGLAIGGVVFSAILLPIDVVFLGITIKDLATNEKAKQANDIRHWLNQELPTDNFIEETVSKLRIAVVDCLKELQSVDIDTNRNPYIDSEEHLKTVIVEVKLLIGES